LILLLNVISINLDVTDIDHVITISRNYLRFLYNDIVKYLDNTYTNCKLYKWVKPIEGYGYTEKGYSELVKFFHNINNKIVSYLR